MLPPWLRKKSAHHSQIHPLKKLVRGHHLHTVCEESRCPNLGECWALKKQTVMILGDRCTRRCHFCSITTAKPLPPDPQEPTKVAQLIKTLGLRYVVVTSVTRDDLPDEGASHWAATVRAIHELNPGIKIELLIPDMEEKRECVRIIMETQPHVMAHNIETVERLTPEIRGRATYRRSLRVMGMFKEIQASMITKSGLMVGHGESFDEVLQTMRDLRAVACDSLTVGQYLQPTKAQRPVIHYVEPKIFEKIQEVGYDLGFKQVAAGPFVRSSYHADQMWIHEAQERDSI
ncbi:MAG: lipoyl synthase [Deltaproteobacteria bacterium RIFCSPLOWO2_12_FULL_50_11]|nr:MAG: lipoyl synthase [Deltaproteobacteria bacterium RIFCSPLOWO2_12_FULL_50_11]